MVPQDIVVRLLQNSSEVISQLQSLCSRQRTMVQEAKNSLQGKQKSRERIKRRKKNPTKQEVLEEEIIPKVKDFNVDIYIGQLGNDNDQDIFNPGKRKQIKKKKKVKSKKETEGRLKPPVNQFMLYLKDHQEQIRGQYPNIKSSEVPRIASQNWRKEDAETRAKYKELYDELLIDYRRRESSRESSSIERVYSQNREAVNEEEENKKMELQGQDEVRDMLNL